MSVLDQLDPETRRLAEAADQPASTSPMLATLSHDDFSDEEWIFDTQHRNADGEAYHREACEKGWEGVIAKKATSTYRHSRSTEWLKFKCTKGQEFVIGGYTDPHGERHGFGALLVGYHDGDELVYAGKIGTGFDHETLERLGGLLRARERRTPPFDRGVPSDTGVHWVTPELVCEAEFTEWTDDGRLRHPRYLGLRRDKGAGEVVRETPVSTS